MTIVVTLIGAALVVAGLSDVFQTLFHPARHGAMSDRIAKTVWRTFRSVASRFPKTLTFAGPAAFVSIISSWVLLTLVGFGLIYWGQSFDNFAAHAGAAHITGFWRAIVNSIEALSTLSEGENSRLSGLRLLSSIEAIIGLTIFTACVSWLLSIYPVIEARRSLAHAATLLHEAEKKTGVDLVRETPTEAASAMFSLAHELLTLRNQMAQFPITHYFYVGERNTTLAGILPYVADLANRALIRGPSRSLHIPATLLGGAVEDFLTFVSDAFLDQHPEDKSQVMKLYAHEHMCEPVSLAWRKRVETRRSA